jgi:LDH2 family malate/lactate/ureidoglycolate dehydrogenase
VTDETVLTHDELKALIRACFAGLGLTAGDADDVAEVLADANLRAIDSHGLDRVPVYLRRVHEGHARGSERLRVVAEHGAIRQLDAGHALGPVAAVRALDAAVELARLHGLGLVTVRNSGHFGHAGFYARRAADAEAVALLFSNAPSSMLVHGGRGSFLGANPLAIGVPLGEKPPFVLDLSSSVTARGKIRRAHILGEPIPPGLAVDRTSTPTTDPVEALAGSVLPVGGAKGSGLAFAITLLTGLLAGADFDDEMGSMYDRATEAQNIGHVFIAVNPWLLADRATAVGRLEALVGRLHALTPADVSEPVRYPGERGADSARERLEQGIPVARQELRNVATACESYGLREVAARARELAERTAEPLGGTRW